MFFNSAANVSEVIRVLKKQTFNCKKQSSNGLERHFHGVKKVQNGAKITVFANLPDKKRPQKQFLRAFTKLSVLFKFVTHIRNSVSKHIRTRAAVRRN